jgi:hypothetical protein
VASCEEDAAARFAPPQPTFDVTTDLPDQDEQEVYVYDTSFRLARLSATVSRWGSSRNSDDDRRWARSLSVALTRIWPGQTSGSS